MTIPVNAVKPPLWPVSTVCPFLLPVCLFVCLSALKLHVGYGVRVCVCACTCLPLFALFKFLLVEVEIHGCSMDLVCIDILLKADLGKKRIIVMQVKQ